MTIKALSAPLNNASLILPPEDRADELKRTTLYYRQCGLSVIPVRGRQYTFCNTDEDRARNSKRPLVEWIPYQKIFATEEKIEEWSARWPFANLACVTGKISGIVVVDYDSEDAVRVASSRGFLDNYRLFLSIHLSVHAICKIWLDV